MDFELDTLFWLSTFCFMAALVSYGVGTGRHRLFSPLIFLPLASSLLLSAAFLACDFFTGEGITESALFTVSHTLRGGGTASFVLPAVGLLVILLVSLGTLVWLLRRRTRLHHAGYSSLSLLFSMLSVLSHPASFQLGQLFQTHHQPRSSDFAQYFKTPNPVLPNPKLNVVYLFAESLERTYLNTKAFPALAPELSEQQKYSIDFSQTVQPPGTEYTIAGMVAALCGMPLFAPFEPNATSAVSSFFPQLTCLGDVLKFSGYDNYFYQGANLRFSGKDVFLKSHGFEHTYGSEELRTIVPRPDETHDWGYYDDTVLNEVWKSYEQLSQRDQPFSLFALTVDTHLPNGFISPTCTRREYELEGQLNPSLSAVTCSQQHVAELIRKIRTSPHFKKTLVVLSSDHLAILNTTWRYLKRFERRNLFLIFRGDTNEARIVEAPRSTLDNGATVLDLLGGGKELGLGRSSLTETSLAAQFPNFREKILEWSHDVIAQWRFPDSVDEFEVDLERQTLQFSGSEFRLPFLLRLDEKGLEPRLEGEYFRTLSQQLATFEPHALFLWIDRCHKMARVWKPEWALSNQFCVGMGQLGGSVEISEISVSPWRGKMKARAGPISISAHQKTTALLRQTDESIRYPSERFLFNLPGAPEEIRSFNGLAAPERWGRWSDANVAPHVTIEWEKPLPSAFNLELVAKAYGENAKKPLVIQLGKHRRELQVTEQPQTYRLHFRNPEAHQKLEFFPPAPVLSREGNKIGAPPRKLGMGLLELSIKKPKTQ